MASQRPRKTERKIWLPVHVDGGIAWQCHWMISRYQRRKPTINNCSAFITNNLQWIPIGETQDVR